jgi:signal transduction histidine kinase
MTHQLKILIVDDKPENLFALEQILADLDVTVIKATSGNEALIASLNHEFALAILDVQMPAMDGYELAELLRSQDRTRNLPIIFLSAVYHEEYYVSRGYKAGAVDFIVKTYNSNILLGKASVFLELARQRKVAEDMTEALQFANDVLESRVSERTASLERTNQALRTSEEELRALSARILTAQEEERKRIAAELHDSLGSSLSAVKLSLEYLLEKSASDKPMQDSLTGLVQMVRQTIDEVRRIMVNLRPPVLDTQGVLAAIDWFLDRFGTVYSGLTMHKEIAIQEDVIPAQLKIVIFRIVQEAVHNAAKHNTTARVSIVLKESDGRIDLSVRDDGVGFDVDAVLSKANASTGLGLTSMRERVAFSGGRFALASASGQGTEISASWALSRS